MRPISPVKDKSPLKESPIVMINEIHEAKEVLVVDMEDDMDMDMDDSVPDEWRDDGQIHLITPMKKLAMEASGEEDAGIWHQVIDEVEEEDDDDDDDDQEEDAYFGSYYNDVVATQDRRHSPILPSSISVRDIANFFEAVITDKTPTTTTTKSEDLNEDLMEEASWNSMPNINDKSDFVVHCAEDAAASVDVVSDEEPKTTNEKDICSLVSIKERRRVFEQFSDAPKLQKDHQWCSMPSLVSLPAGGTTSVRKSAPLALVGAHTPSIQSRSSPECPPVKNILKSYETKVVVSGQEGITRPPSRPSAPDAMPKAAAAKEVIAAYRWDDDSNGEIYTERSPMDEHDLSDPDDCHHDNCPLYVVENGKEYRLLPLRQRVQMFESNNSPTTPDKPNVIMMLHKSQLPKEVVLIENQSCLIRAPPQSPPPPPPPPPPLKLQPKPQPQRVLQSLPTSPPAVAATKRKSVPFVDTIKSSNVPYIFEEQELLQSINIVKNIKNKFGQF